MVWRTVVVPLGLFLLVLLTRGLGQSALSVVSLSLVGKQPITAHVSLRGVDLAVARPLLPAGWQFLRPAGRIDLTGDLDGTLNPQALNARGRLAGTGLVAAGVRVGAVGLDWALVGQVLQIKGFQAKPGFARSVC